MAQEDTAPTVDTPEQSASVKGKTCAWCSLPARIMVITHHAVVKKMKGEVKTIHDAKYAPACMEHARTLERTMDKTAAAKRAKNQRYFDKKRQMRFGE